MGLGHVIAPPEAVFRHLVCAICTDVIDDAVRTPCQHVFCRDCIQQALAYKLECPLDHSPLTLAQLHSDHIINRMIGDLTSLCPNAQSGCAWSGQISACATHLLACPEQHTSCRFKNCGIVVPRKFLVQHEEECTFKSETTALPHMNETVSASIVHNDSLHHSDTVSPNGVSNTSNSWMNAHVRTPAVHGTVEISSSTRELIGALEKSFLGYGLLLFMLVTEPRKLAKESARLPVLAHARLSGACCVIAAFLTSAPLALSLVALCFGFLPHQSQSGLPLNACLFLCFLSIVLWMAKWIAVCMPLLLGVNIVDEVPMKFCFSLLVSVIMVLASSKDFSPVEVAIIAASTVGTFVIYYIRNASKPDVSSPVKHTILDLLCTATSVLVTGLRSSIALGLIADVVAAVVYLGISLLCGLLHGIAESQSSARSTSSSSRNRNVSAEFIQQLFNELLLSVGGTLFVLEGGAVGGVRVIYVIAAANFTKLLLWNSNLTLPWDPSIARTSTATLLSFLSGGNSSTLLRPSLGLRANLPRLVMTFLGWAVINLIAYDLFGAHVYERQYNVSLLCTVTIVVSCLWMLSLYSVMRLGRYFTNVN